MPPAGCIQTINNNNNNNNNNLFNLFEGIDIEDPFTFFISLKLSTLFLNMISLLGRRVILLIIGVFCFASILHRLKVDLEDLSLTLDLLTLAY